MGERKGVNKYYPPDYDPSKGSINKHVGQHPLRERAKKIGQGILVIRFEMPYNIWCGGCGIHIAMGVRYNAEKKKVDKYYTTPIYEFRMRCHLCPQYFTIRTDPKNHDYVITDGARRKEQRWDPHENEQIVPEDKATQRKLATDPMYLLEHGSEDKNISKKRAGNLSRLAVDQDRWRDDYTLNKLARGKFRAEKKEIIQRRAEDAALLKKSSLDIKLAAETEEDRTLARLLRYKNTESPDLIRKRKRQLIDDRPLFGNRESVEDFGGLVAKRRRLGLTVKSPHLNVASRGSQDSSNTCYESVDVFSPRSTHNDDPLNEGSIVSNVSYGPITSLSPLKSSSDSDYNKYSVDPSNASYTDDTDSNKINNDEDSVPDSNTGVNPDNIDLCSRHYKGNGMNSSNSSSSRVGGAPSNIRYNASNIDASPSNASYSNETVIPSNASSNSNDVDPSNVRDNRDDVNPSNSTSNFGKTNDYCGSFPGLDSGMNVANTELLCTTDSKLGEVHGTGDSKELNGVSVNVPSNPETSLATISSSFNVPSNPEMSLATISSSFNVPSNPETYLTTISSSFQVPSNPETSLATISSSYCSSSDSE